MDDTINKMLSTACKDSALAVSSFCNANEAFDRSFHKDAVQGPRRLKHMRHAGIAANYKTAFPSTVCMALVAHASSALAS